MIKFGFFSIRLGTETDENTLRLSIEHRMRCIVESSVCPKVFSADFFVDAKGPLDIVPKYIRNTSGGKYSCISKNEFICTDRDIFSTYSLETMELFRDLAIVFKNTKVLGVKIIGKVAHVKLSNQAAADHFLKRIFYGRSTLPHLSPVYRTEFFDKFVLWEDETFEIFSPLTIYCSSKNIKASLMENLGSSSVSLASGILTFHETDSPAVMFSIV